MRAMLTEKLYVLAELAQEFNLRIWSLWGGDYCIAFANRDYISVCCRVRPVFHSESTVVFKAPIGIEGDALLEAVSTGEFESLGWEFTTRPPALPFEPKHLFSYPHWMDTPPPARVPNRLYGFLMGKEGVEWNVFVDDRGVKYLLLRDADAEVIVIYPSVMWKR